MKKYFNILHADKKGRNNNIFNFKVVYNVRRIKFIIVILK